MSEPVLDQWVSELCAALDLDPSAVGIDLVLDLARDAAHAVARPAAPLTAFVVGLAAGRSGCDPDAVHAAVALARVAISKWDDAQPTSSSPA